MGKEPVLYQASPSMFRNHPIWFIVVLLLCLVLVGIPIMFVWWLKCKTVQVTVTTERTIVERGLLSKMTNEVWHRDVRNVRIYQSFLQRLLGVGEIEISSAGQAGVEISVKGMPAPHTIRDLIDQNRD